MNKRLELEVRKGSLINKGTHNVRLIAKVNRKLRKLEAKSNI
ncbi:hypothetical protein ACFO6R_08380 [Eubacterium multiforme]|uniref:Uncharacterized protein n=1 Tax=Eubacterium multiforme TaxID=83339 RepID=A0ABT9UUL6_9FIRM|nr:hypothetical protein [Eubacterium multiforme]MDQ0150019.1 hypothetical protein [Eubacterium multiforme]